MTNTADHSDNTETPEDAEDINNDQHSSDHQTPTEDTETAEPLHRSVQGLDGHREA
jgi:hypothetical protein